MTNLDQDFINSFNTKKAFWYTFKRSVHDLGHILILFSIFKNFEGKNWHNKQKKNPEKWLVK